MGYQIRKAKIEDLERIKVLLQKLSQKEHDEFDDTMNPDYALTEEAEKFLRQRITDGVTGLCLVALVDDKIVGYLAGGIHMSEDYRFSNKIGEGESILIEERYRGQGIGTKLLTLFETWCKEKGLPRMRLVASSANKEAIKLYKSLGFNEYDVQLEKSI